ncbi:SGNH/GDSL hydrolase family protein [Cereibacter azotoformans]|uniref:GDSL-like lipase/acylhydrolase family protein n=1 Tax=Cereibacter azotoformans TaxID=43057 RepID=A0A2T5JYR3_9RHOB|nr:SGNH/GDSL hydrolase family protein [Cereibacter azotoformans]MBO4170711.1 SGNH/GDSL hydrolase family protein [Cereibacter azotoformans]PTR15285.1 GDSL-like lipase/acylhydrolase family protein [Cereibacter azotoformans]UIJ30001.1 SGNH/GDSL hydrolase family protein [Cereibacter azotoformans]
MHPGLGLGLTAQRGRATSSSITATSAPTFAPLSPGVTISSVWTAGTYASTAGTISAVVETFVRNSEAVTASTVAAEGDVISVTVLVTDSAGNQRTFSCGPQAVPYAAPMISGLQDLSASRGASISINAAVSASGSGLVYSLTGPEWLSINPATGMITGAAPEAHVTTAATVTVTNPGGSASDTFAVEVVAAPTVTPAANNILVINGDSRTASGMTTLRAHGSAAETNPLENAGVSFAAGWQAHALAALSHRVLIPKGGNFAIGAETTTQMAARAERDAAQAAGFGAKVCVFLGGVNDTTLTSAQSIANYIAIFNAWAAQGIRLVVCNEAPRDNLAGANLTAHQERRAWLEDPQRAVDWPGYVRVNSWDALADPADPTKWAPGLSYDGLHPTYAGSSILGETIAAALAPLYPDPVFPSRLDLPTSAEGCLNTAPMMTGATGTIQATPAAVITGDVATGWILSAERVQDGLSITAGKGTDPDGYDEQIITLSGFASVSAACGARFANAMTAAVSALSPGGVIRLHGRLRIDAGHTGLLGVRMGGFIQGTGLDAPADAFKLRYFGAFAGLWNASGTNVMDGSAADLEIMSQDLVIPANWAAATGRQGFAQVNILCMGGNLPVSATVRLSRLGVRRVL